MATFGVRYDSRVASAYGGHAYVRLLERGYTGDATTLLFDERDPEGEGYAHPTDSPLSLSWGRKGSDIYTPLLASHAEAQFWKVGGTGLLDELLGAPNGRFLLEIEETFGEAGTRSLYWTGRVKTDVYSDSTMTAPNRVAVQAVDGIGSLKDVPYTSGGGPNYSASTGLTYPDGSTPTVRESLLVHVQRALGKLSYSLPLTSALAWYPYQAATATDRSSAEDPLAHLEVSGEAFADDEGDALDCHAVLKQILYVTGAQLFQYGGRWHLVSRELMAGGKPYTRHVYAADGTAQGTEEAAGALQYDPAQGHERRKGKRSYRPSRGTAETLYSYGPVGDFIGNGDFQEGRGLTDGAPGWNYNDGFTGIHSVDAKKYEDYTQDDIGTPFIDDYGQSADQVSTKLGLYLPSMVTGPSDDPSFVRSRVRDDGVSAQSKSGTSRIVPEGLPVAFGADFKVRPKYRPVDNPILHETYAELKVGDYFLVPISPDDEGIWQDCEWRAVGETASESKFPVVAFQGKKAGEVGVPVDKDNSFTFITPPHPTGGTPTITLYSSGEQNPGDDRKKAFAVIWDNVRLYLADENGDVLGARRTIVSTGAEGEKDEVEVYLGEGPTLAHPTRLTWDGALATDWKRGPYASGEAESALLLDELMAATWVSAQASVLEVRQETYALLTGADDAPYRPGQAFAVPGARLASGSSGTARYHPSSLSKDLYHATDAAEWVRLQYTDVSYETTSEAEEGDGFDAPSDDGERGIDTTLETAAADVRELAGYVASKNPLATTTAEVASGSISSLPVTAQGEAVLQKGDRIVVVNHASGRPIEMQVTDDQGTDDTTLEVADADDATADVALDGALASGSGVYFGHRALLRIVRQLESKQDQQADTLSTHRRRISTLEDEVSTLRARVDDCCGDVPVWSLSDVRAEAGTPPQYTLSDVRAE